ncbi:copper resistance CopC family protein [Bailinhaonella thermotolerans]|uniref:Copper resistance protein CopC n=1 Tax=Bailinhaonella thermotolerans TaxID=1070861 RepID=A0A3A4AV08_9ACTN|nr:copper resistance protein CopC [Bailinhaonella thermotolerans]RJL32541.1 copper resistance protein CopC [Bailinhaonella thermotolerans]
MRSLRAGVVAVFILLTTFVLGTGTALAHDRLKSSNPAKDASVEKVEKVELVFSNTVRLPTVIVSDADGKRFESGPAETDKETVTQALNGALPPGKYKIAYRVVSSDGHPIEGVIPFTVMGIAGGPLPGSSDSASPAASPTPEDSQAPSAAPSAPASTPAPAPTATATPAAGKSSAGSGLTWWWVGAGLVAGVGLGLLFSFRKKKDPRA